MDEIVRSEQTHTLQDQVTSVSRDPGVATRVDMSEEVHGARRGRSPVTCCRRLGAFSASQLLVEHRQFSLTVGASSFWLTGFSVMSPVFSAQNIQPEIK